MPHKVYFYTITLIILATSFIGINLQQEKLRELRSSYQLVDQEEIKSAPPVVAFTTISLGGFRGLVADYLWVRSHILQERGDYFETYQLAQWITMLQPRVSSAITNLAWNMAYNISVTYSNYEDRWRWIQKGIELLRDDALSKTKNNPDIYHYLGWIYQHKIGQEADEANRYYKWRLAEEMERVLGYNTNWELLVESPLPKDLIISEQAFLEKLKEAKLTIDTLKEVFRSTEQLPEELLKLYPNKEDQQTIIYSLRHQWLVEVYKLDPQVMKELNQLYSPAYPGSRFSGLDWRMPETHAIYWAYSGSVRTHGQADLQCDRMVIQCLAIALRSGRVSGVTSYKDQYGATIPALITEPNLNTIAPLDRLLTRQHEKYGENIVGSSLEGFYVEAITTLYLYGYPNQATEYLNKLKNFYSERNKPFNQNITIDQFTLDRVIQTMGGARGSREVLQVIGGYLNVAFRSLINGDDERAASMERIALLMHQKYRHSLGELRLSRINIANFKELYDQILVDFYQNLPQEEWKKILIAKHPEISQLLIQEKAKKNLEKKK